MRKSKTMRFASVLLVLTLMTSCFVGSTFAKYTSTATSSDTATVAKWDVEVNDGKISVASPTIAFNLFDTINDTGNTTAETDVAATLIAPGTAGSFALKIENLSQVNAQYTITLTETNTGNIPLQYSVDGSTWVDSIAGLTMTELTNQAIAMESGTATETVYWQWGFDGGHAGQTNATDTELGIAAQTTAPTVTVTATITVEQVD